MAADNKGGAAGERNKRNAVATRLSYLRNARFETKGFKSNDPVPSLEEARQMADYNRRLINGQRPTPSVSI